ncbi:MAG: hydratase [Mesorhizobium sp.]|uniref:2-keto-4-pentenoate hydratase n=1 Tax=Mesorhizobium sp. TaxID=1871066 RepID=UPI001AD338C3|nr:fumarylacetoacetate hydrolase family protein [Mesorhizobium sp.]MBN9221257.1 hydratase [Mesorhizobium sp.]
MDIATVKAASALLVRHWEEGTVLEKLPGALRPKTRMEGYLIQAQIESISKSPLFGWKIAATSAAGQKHIAVDGPLAGRLLAEKVHEDGDVIPFGGNRMRVVELEFAYRMGRDLPPKPAPYQTHEVFDAIADLHLAIEIPDSRFADFVTAGGPQIIADNACANRFLLGPKAPAVWRELHLAKHRMVGRIGSRLEREGVGANVLGDPRLALTWLVNELSSLNVTLAAGQVVTTGTCVVPMEVEPGDVVTADFGVLGTVGCRIGNV